MVWGIQPPDKWVCLIGRDSAYLPELGYHDYRDVDIKTYRKAALTIARHGFHVFRMGSKVHEELGADHPLVHDYATNGWRSDFMDIYLGAYCTFAISTPTGIDAIPAIYGRPMGYVNMVPIEYFSTWIHGVAIWKHHLKNGKRMTPKQIFESGAGIFQRAEQFTEAGITLVDNTAEEINDVALEMIDYVCFKRKLGNQSFWDQFPSGAIDGMTGQRIHADTIRLRIGAKLMEGYK